MGVLACDPKNQSTTGGLDEAASKQKKFKKKQACRIGALASRINTAFRIQIAETRVETRRVERVGKSRNFFSKAIGSFRRFRCIDALPNQRPPNASQNPVWN